MTIHTSDREQQVLLRVLRHHVGASKGVGVRQLALQTHLNDRRVRHIISDLREAGYSICATPKSGYFMASSNEELETCCRFLRRRAMHSLRLEARLRKLALPDLIHQLRFTEV